MTSCEIELIPVNIGKDFAGYIIHLPLESLCREFIHLFYGKRIKLLDPSPENSPET